MLSERPTAPPDPPPAEHPFSTDTNEPWVLAAAAAAGSAAIWAAEPRGDTAPHDWAFQYASHKHRATQASLQNEHQTELLKSGGVVDGFDMPDVIFANPRDSTAEALRLIGEAARVNKEIQNTSQRTFHSFENVARLSERLALPLHKEKDLVETDRVMEDEIIQTAEALIRDIQAGNL
jgi:hypothetical protein